MNTKFFGSCGWQYYHTVSFNYPYKIDPNNPEQLELMMHYRILYLNSQYTLPCKYCRQSYKKFLKIHNIDDYLDSRQSFTYWFYLIHDEVNKKLYEQETDAVIKIRNKLYQQKMAGKLSNSQYVKKIAEETDRLLFTEPTSVARLYLKEEDKLFRNMNSGKITKRQYTMAVKKEKNDILFANSSPSYEDVCKFYESQRAECGKKKGEIASCRI